MLEIIFNTKTYRNRQTKRPSIETNEGSQKKYVQIKANVVTRPDSTYPLVFKPYKFDISQYGSKPRTKLSFDVTNMSDQEITLTLIDVPVYDMFKVDLPDKIEPGKVSRGEITLNDKFADQEFEKSITIECNDPEMSRFTIPIKRVIRVPSETSQATSKDASKPVTIPTGSSSN